MYSSKGPAQTKDLFYSTDENLTISKMSHIRRPQQGLWHWKSCHLPVKVPDKAHATFQYTGPSVCGYAVYRKIPIAVDFLVNFYSHKW